MATKLSELPPLDVHQRYNVREACIYLRISRALLYGDISRGKIKIIKHGTRTFIAGHEIARLSNPA